MRKYGTYAWFGGHVPMDVRFQAIKDAGFDSVALLYSDEYEKEIGKKEDHILCALKHGLEIENFHLPYSHAFDLFVEDEVKAKALLKVYEDGIKTAQKYHVPVVVIHLTQDVIPHPIPSFGEKRLKKLIEMGRKHHVKLAFENLRKEGIDYLQYVLDSFQEETVGFCYDYGHDHCFNFENECEILKKYGNRLYALHLHGNDGVWDYHRRLRDGNGDLKKLKAILDTLSITCPYSLEVIASIDCKDYDSLKKYLLTMKEDLLKL